LENVILPAIYAGMKNKKERKKADMLLTMLGLPIIFINDRIKCQEGNNKE